MKSHHCQKTSMFALFLFSVAFLLLPSSPEIDWQSVEKKTEELFKEYLSIDTCNPPGDVSAAAEFLSKALKKEDVPTDLIWTDKGTGRVNVLARLRGTGKKRPLMMLNHMDTVPFDRLGWTVDPLAAINKGGYIYGRGALDMKNTGIVQLMTMILLKQNDIRLDRDVVFLAVADEETSGTLGSGWIVKNMWPEIDAEYVLDEGGFGTQGFFTKDERLVFSVGVAEKKVLWLRLSTAGTSGHGSMPPKENSNSIMAQALSRITSYKTPIHITPVVSEMINRLGRLDDTPYNNALKRNTISLTVMKGFVGDPPKSNVIPGRTEAVLDCRLLPDQDPNTFVDKLRHIINDPLVKIDYIERPIESIISPYETELFKIIEKETHTVYPDSIVVPHLVIYGTDSRFFRRKGASCYGFFPGPVTMEEYRTIHGNDERIRERSLRAAVRIYHNVVKRFCEAKNL
ncbi:MAG: M20/M25/M40 family metallo-hydrolase [Candidatus Aminicenantes bacterium]|nr:MAG: M20/M25/M40 family metallo-hydrolase [Candidatus Aminicenantes bacterium]